MSRSRRQGTWFEFPLTKNIKFWWIVDPDGREYVSPPGVNHWGPRVSLASDDFREHWPWGVYNLEGGRFEWTTPQKGSFLYKMLKD